MPLLEQILLSMFLGALIGVEREYHKGEIGIGLRTTIFLSLFGTISTFFMKEYAMPLVFIISLAVVGGFAIALYWYRARAQRKHVGMTSSLTMLLVFFIGSVVSFGFYREAVVLSIAVFILLFSKRRLVKSIRHLTDEELLNAIEFAIIAFVIYPFLPEGDFFFVNIKQVWEVVLIVSVISFAAFLAIRHFGSKRGVILTALFGGAYSSDAAVVTLVSAYKRNRRLLQLYVFAIMATVSVMFFRNIAIGIAVMQDASILLDFAKYGIVLAIYLVLVFWLLYKKLPRQRAKLEMHSPFAIKPALIFGLIFLCILLVSKAVAMYIGPEAIIPLSFLTGLVNSAGAVGSSSLLALSGAITMQQFAYSVVFASMGSMLVSATTALFFREAKLSKEMLKYVLVAMAILVVLAVI